MRQRHPSRSLQTKLGWPPPRAPLSLDRFRPCSRKKDDAVRNLPPTPTLHAPEVKETLKHWLDALVQLKCRNFESLLPPWHLVGRSFWCRSCSHSGAEIQAASKHARDCGKAARSSGSWTHCRDIRSLRGSGCHQGMLTILLGLAMPDMA